MGWQRFSALLLPLALWMAPWPAASQPAKPEAGQGAATAKPDAAGTPVPEAGKPAETPPPPGPIPLGEIPARAGAASAAVRDIEAALAGTTTSAVIESRVPALARDIDARHSETTRVTVQRPSIEVLNKLEAGWRKLRETLIGWLRDLRARSERLDRDLARLVELENVWNETLALPRASEDADLVKQVDALLAGIERTRAAVEAQRAYVTRVQSSVAAQDLRVTEAVEMIRQAREESFGRLLVIDSLPVWRAGALAPVGARDGQESLAVHLTALEAYAERRWGRVFLHAALFALLTAGLFRVRRMSLEFARADPSMERVARVFSTPAATAMLLSLLATPWIYPQAPSLLWVLVGAAALVPTVIVLRPVVDRQLWPLLYAVIAFFFVDQVRAVTASMQGVPRLVFLAEMVAAVLFLLWLLAHLRRQARNPAAPPPRAALSGAGIACAAFALAAAANAAGYVALGNLVGSATLGAVYLGVILYAAVQILDALVALAMRTRPLTGLGMVRRHQELLRRRTHYVLATVAGVLWALSVLERLALREPLMRGLGQVFSAEMRAGALTISLGDVTAFAVVVWASFVVSRLVRFVLDEDIYPRAQLQRGLHYAISRTVHYLILVAGFLVAIAMLGFDMTKFTILAGAFTVGVGFGLQNIFNNFVSGLILLFERPVQVGDMIQIEDTAGIVERIGIRASVVRASTGSEIIVPNGKLISERLVNWTLSAHRRGFELPVAVAHGADPRRVIETVQRVAAAHPAILRDPAPEALFVRLGPDWMGFELRAYTGRVEEWMKVRSELAVALSEALAAEKIAVR